MEQNVCLYLKKKCVRKNQLIQGENFFKDGVDGEFNNLTDISTDMNNPQVDNLLWFSEGASMQVEVSQLGTILMEGDSLITLNPNQDYYLTAYVYEAIDPPPTADTNYFLNLAKTGWADATFNVLENYQLKVGTEGTWTRLSAKMVTGINTTGQIKIVQSGADAILADGKLFHIDAVSISSFIPYIGDRIYYKEEVTLPVKNNIDATLLLKIRDLTKPEFLFQRSKARTVSIPSTKESEKYFGFSHRLGSIRGNKSWKAEYFARLEVDGIEVLSGLFTLDSLTNTNCDTSSYEGKILSSSKVWLSQLAQSNFCDLDWTEYRQVFSINEIESTWLNNGDDSDFVIYPFETREIPIVVGNNYVLNTNDMSLGWFIKPLLVKLFRHVGYNVEFKGANWDKIKNTIFQGITKKRILEYYDGAFSYQGFHFGNQRIQVGEIDFPDYEGNEFDPFNYINGNCVQKVNGFELFMTVHIEKWTGTIYDAPEGDASFILPFTSAQDGLGICARAEFVLDTVAAASTDHAYWVRVDFYEGANVLSSQFIYDSQEPLWDTDNLTIIQTTDLGDGDWLIDYTQGGNSFTHFFGASMFAGDGTQQFFARLRQVVDPLDAGFRIEQEPVCLNLKTFLGSVAAMFNLMHVESDKPNTICIIERDDYYALGSKAIEVDDILTNGEVSQVRLGQRKGKSYLFAYAPNDTDIWFENYAPANFGNSTFINAEGNSASEQVEMTKNLVFNATFYWESVIWLWVPRYQKPFGEDGILGFRPFNYDGLIALPNPSMFEIEALSFLGTIIGSKVYAEYPRATFTAVSGHGDTNLAYHDYQDNQGLVNKHWLKELILISENRLVSMYFIINAEFIRTLDYSRYWKVKDVLYILNGIIDFDYIKRQNTKVELVPINTFYGTDNTC